MQRQPVFCGKDCGGNACPLLAEIDNGRVLRVVNNPYGGKYLKGCQRGFNLPLELYAAGRLETPLIRVGERGSGKFRAASWDEATDVVVNRLSEIINRYGATSILNLSSAGSTSALHNTYALTQRFLSFLGGSTVLTGSYSNGAARFILEYLLGSNWVESGWDAATMRYSKMIILWGANVLEARLGTEINQRLVEARKRGTKIIVIDPRLSETAKRLADWWIPCRPGTDVALMLATLHVLLRENMVDRGFINDHSVGFDELEGYVMGMDGGVEHNPVWAEGICGVPESEIIRFARTYGSTKPCMLLPGYSIQRVFAGEETFRLTIALQIATGNFGLKGGSTGSLNNRLPSPRVGKISFPVLPGNAEIPVTRWPDAVLQGRRGEYPCDIHGIYAVGGNFLNQGCDIRKNIEAFQKVDFAVCHEMMMTPTAKFCDVVFPAAHTLEREDIGIPWLGNFLTYKPEVSSPKCQVRTDYDIFCELSNKLGFLSQFSEGRSAAQWIQLFMDQSEIPDQSAFRETGVYIASDQERVGLEDFRIDPVNHPLDTPSGKVEISCRRYAEETGFPAIPTWQQPPRDPRFPLLLITPKSPWRTHSQGSGIAEIQRKAQHALVMASQDAALRGILDGEMVRVYNEQGESILPVHLSSDLMPGVACLPEGVWVNLDETGVDRAGAANMFTASAGTQPGTACVMHGIGIEVSKIHDEKVE